MKKCLLCLEINQDFFDCIKVNSLQWQEENIKSLIEKHFWPLENIEPSSLMCSICWQELNDFHKFYARIEKAHENLHETILKTEEEVHLPEQPHNFDSDDCKSEEEDCKDLFDTDGLIECPIEPDILMEQPIPNEFVIEDEIPLIKNELDIDPCKEVDDDDDVPLKQLRKRGRPVKDVTNDKEEKRVDPLRKTRRSKQSKVSTNRNKKAKEIAEKSVTQSTESSSITNTNVDLQQQQQSEVKPDSQDATDDPKNSFETSHHDNDDFNTDSDYQPINDNKPAVKPKRARHRNPDEKTLQEYDRIIAENYKIFCSLCQLPIDNFIALRKHFKTEHKQRGYAHCCKRNFFTRGSLVDHIRFHLNPEHFKCTHCGKIFSDRSRLVCHVKLHDDENKLDKCEVCGKLFAEKGVLKKHLLTHSSDRELFPCTVCGKSFTNTSILNHHIESVHLNKFVQICDICGKSIRCRTAFDSHRRKHEPKTAEVSCDVCGLLLSNIEGMRRHRNSQHPEGGKKEHTCHICLKVSPTQRALKSHIRNVHEMGYNYKCNLCDKAFKRPAVLRDHMATHTGTALYSCPWCPKTFVSNGNMYNHRKKDHPREWEELNRQKYAGNVAGN